MRVWNHLTARAGVLNNHRRVDSEPDPRGLVPPLDGVPRSMAALRPELGLLSRGRGGERAASVLAGQPVFDVSRRGATLP